jgi:hypothetical protein
MGAAGNKKPKKDKSSKHGKHIPSYQIESEKQEIDDLKKRK